MEHFFDSISNVNTVDRASELLFQNTKESPILLRALDFCISAHEGQKRKSGEPYSVHPILVATIAAYYGSDEAVLLAALLHDVVEDTEHSLDEIAEMFGEDVANLVNGLTKVATIREEKLAPSGTDEKLISSALSFRKMLVASINDIRVLFVKLCDRLHNMMTLGALPPHKQKRIAEETLVVYAPIAHRLGISSIKNELEDLSFYYIFPNEYKKIEEYLQDNKQTIQLRLNRFVAKLTKLLVSNGVSVESFKIHSRIKRHYSIYLKMQRKGVSIDEVLDLLAVRIIVNEPIECYKVLGIIHLNYKPIISRFKDYITLPKENGYQTIHTTVFDDQVIYEVQIRTMDMHGVAEYGVAAHWKYKSGGRAPSLDWLSNLQYQDNNLEEFYELAKNDLYSEEVMVYSPKGDLYTLPSGSVALDFAYAVHSEIGDRAICAQIDKQKASLLSVLKNGNIVKIITGEQIIPRCSWLDAVKTSRAKSHIRINCTHRLKEIDRLNAISMLATVFERERHEIEVWVKENHLEGSIYKAARDINFFKELKNRLKAYYRENASLFTKLRIKILKLREYKFENISVYSNYNISEISFDYCCHPKRGDAIMGIKSGSKVFIHHKLCENGFKEISEGASVVFVDWEAERHKKYKLVASLENKKGVLASFLQFLADNDINVLSIELGKEEGHISYCSLSVETEIKETRQLKNLISKRTRVIDIYSEDDAYRGSE